jgi:hypothetical protein
MRRRDASRVAGLMASAILVGYSAVGAGSASSPFPAGQDPPVIYSGHLSAGGTPLSGTHVMAIHLWSATDTSVAANQLCHGADQSIEVVDGNFQIQLDVACVEVFSRRRQLWYQVVVDGAALPMQQVGSVPFALHSMQSGLDGARLAQTRTVTHGADGYRTPITYGGLVDTGRNESCSAWQTLEGGALLTRCLPEAAGMWDQYFDGSLLAQQGWYPDSQCLRTYDQPGMRFYINGLNPNYAVDKDASGAITAIYTATSVTTTPYIISNGQCIADFGYTIYGYTLGPAIPFSDFVQMTTVTE